ncbi:MAG: zinc ribbon domain-containing protein [Candidatus Kariarchaeaceae archaeon]|jgi:hypothetical protein
MYNRPFQPPVLNNDGAIKILWGGVVSYSIGFVTPQIELLDYGTYYYTWDLLTPLGLGLILLSIALTVKGITKAKKFEGSRKFGIGGAIIMLMPISSIYSEANLDDYYYGYETMDPTFGYYLLWLGAILSTIGSLKAASYPTYLYGAYRQAPGYAPQYGQQYSQNPQQQYSQQPLQPQYGQPPYNQNPQQNYDRQSSAQPPSDYDPQPAKPLDNHSNIPISKNTEFSNFCGNCAYNNEIGVKFCANCGTKTY